MDTHLAGPILLAVPALLAANAFFTAAEFALLTLRRSAAEARPREGETGAARVPPALGRADELALAAQLGRSAASVLLGYLAALAVRDAWAGFPPGAAPLPYPWAAAVVAAVVLLHALLGEQLPKLLAGGRAERVARLTLGPLRAWGLMLRPLTWPLARLLPAVLRRLGVSAGFHPLVYTPEEIRMFVARSSEEGVVEEDEREMIHGVFEFTETVAREVMTPRTEMVAVPAGISLDELLDVVVDEGHSRFPVYEGSIDSIVGVVLTKDLLPLFRRGDEAFDVRRVMREPYFVPDTKPVDEILAELRQRSVHLAIVLDEFGGTYGLLTMEDLLEEIVGDINDEHDVAEPEFAATPEGDVLIDGGASISEVNERFGVSLPEADFDTVGGYVFGALERVPVPGDVVTVPAPGGEMELRVEEVDERRVALVRLTRRTAARSPA
ncbi:MAG TPA: hemolysin family protein [Longimicrobiaceae bacterium]|nr:hemolysin family protein [Longimicrobiaceae bacterium]